MNSYQRRKYLRSMLRNGFVMKLAVDVETNQYHFSQPIERYVREITVHQIDIKGFHVLKSDKTDEPFDFNKLKSAFNWAHK